LENTVNWLLKNTLIGSIAGIFFGENWIEEKPKLATGIKIFLYSVFFIAGVGFILGLVN